MQPSWPEMLIFAALLCASLYGFWRRFRVVVHAIREAKPDASWTLGSVAARTRGFIWEVLLQGKVIRDRPLVGIAHAFVFWGFCAFALVTLNHVVTGFGFTLLPRQSVFGQIYFGFVGLFAVAVAISIASLAARRYLARPVWLGKVAPESGYIALLIFMLMVTYLATFQVDEASLAGKANWWLHTLALLIFMPLIPHTKHLHLVP